MDCEPLAEGATKEEEEAWVAKFTPIFERLVEENIEAMKENSLEELAAKCVDIQTDTQANKVAYDVYRLNLIQQSILEPDDANPGKHKLVFDTPEEVEEMLSPGTIDMLSDRIAEEVRQEKNIPLS